MKNRGLPYPETHVSFLPLNLQVLRWQPLPIFFIKGGSQVSGGSDLPRFSGKVLLCNAKNVGHHLVIMISQPSTQNNMLPNHVPAGICGS